jgi:hypothetical protein
MKCPFCNEDMKKGVIQSKHEIIWSPEKMKILGAAFMHEDAVVLSIPSFLKHACVVANCCEKCKKVLIDYKENGEGD